MKNPVPNKSMKTNRRHPTLLVDRWKTERLAYSQSSISAAVAYLGCYAP